MTASAIFAKAIRDAIAVNGGLCVFRGTDRVIDTVAVIVRSVAEIGFGAVSGQGVWQAELIAEDVGEVKRGDTLSDSAGRTWTLREELSGDEYVAVWSIERQ